MLLPAHSSGPSGRQGRSARARLWDLFTSKPAKVLSGSLIATVILAWLWFRVGWSAIPASKSPIAGILDDTLSSTEPQKGRLHLLIPATSKGPDLCKLLLSAQVLGYPTPVLINYGDHEAADPYVQHLAKVEGILNYLEELEHDDRYVEDLVLIIDGYDIWFQLRPDVLIKRFYEVNAAANAKAVETYGQEMVDKYDIRQTVVFGPDKLCWPVDFARPACWAVPESHIPESTFGPRIPGIEDRDKNQARWLNSGTVLGSASDLKEIFEATLNTIRSDYITDSDQFYFANIFGNQEVVRLGRKPELLEKMSQIQMFDGEDPQHGDLVRLMPKVIGEVKTEYHMGLDYDSSMFQTLAYWKQHLAWVKPTDSWSGTNGTRSAADPRSFSLPEDIRESLPPFEAFKYGLDTKGHPSWPDVQLLYNVVTKQFPVLLHVTGNPSEKNLRYYWWQKLWFQAEAERLRVANVKLDQSVISTKPINGIFWYNAEAGDAEEIEASGKGGAWTDRRGWLGWKRLCKHVEEEIFHVPGEELYHPIWRPPPKDSDVAVQEASDQAQPANG